MKSSLNLFQAFLIVLAFYILPAILQRVFSFNDNPEIAAVINGSINIVVLIVILLYYFGREHPVNEFGLTKVVNPAIMMAAILGGIATVHMQSSYFTILPSSMIKEMFESILNHGTGLLTFISMVLIAPIVEEIFFRGIIMSRLIKRYSPAVAIVFLSLLFAVLHPFIIGPFLFGLFMGWIYFRSHNLLYCIITHVAVNGTAFVSRNLLFDRNSTVDSFIEQSSRNAAKVAIFSILVLSLVMFFLIRRFKVADYGETGKRGG